MYGRKWTAERKEKQVAQMSSISKSMWDNEEYRAKQTKSHSKPVRCIELGLEFESIKAAYEALNMTNKHIPAAIRNNSICNGYHWEYIL